MDMPKVWTFFYGSYMNPEVLAEVELQLEDVRTAQLSGFELSIDPLANIHRSRENCVFGIVGRATHAKLDELYAHAQTILGGYYLPEAVLVRTFDGQFLPAMCWISPGMDSGTPDPAYVQRIAGPAREYGFPTWYLEHIHSFAPSEGASEG